MPKKERLKSADKRKWHFFSKLSGGLAQNSLWNISAVLIMAGLESISVI